LEREHHDVMLAGFRSGPGWKNFTLKEWGKSQGRRGKPQKVMLEKRRRRKNRTTGGRRKRSFSCGLTEENRAGSQNPAREGTSKKRKNWAYRTTSKKWTSLGAIACEWGCTSKSGELVGK